MKIIARNALEGTVIGVTKGEVVARFQMDIGGGSGVMHGSGRAALIGA